MVEEWNANMDINFSPSWKHCLDESMSKWLNEYTCPGFMFVSRKPWKFGNEWHDIEHADTFNHVSSQKNATAKGKQLEHFCI